MKLTNYSILNILRFLEELQMKKLPQKVLFAIIKNIKILAKEREVYQEALKKILDDYKDFIVENQVDNNGFPLIEDVEKKKDFYKEVEELLEISSEVNFYKIDEELLNYDSEKYDELSGKELIDLMTILCKGE